MKFLASLFGLIAFAVLSPAASADTCTVPGHPTCTITCPSNQTCQARWVSTYGGACARRCVPKPRTPPPAVTVAPPSQPLAEHVIHKHIGGVKYEDVTVSAGQGSTGAGAGEHKPYSHEIISPRDPQSGLPTGQRMHRPFAKDSRRCRSQAYEKKDAEEFCRKELNCAVTCQGDSMARRWICWCT